MPAGRDSAGPIFFVHVMKTGGSTFRRRMQRQLGSDAVFPYPPLDPPEMQPNVDVTYLAGLPTERLAAIRGFTGHLPYFATELVPTPSCVLTILRDPVERTISFLKQHHRDRGLGPERSLESIYDLPWHRNLHMLNAQVRVFASAADEGIKTVMHRLDIDARRMELAKDHLQQVDVLGLQEHYDEFVDRAEARLGWPSFKVNPQRVSTPVPVPEALRRRIAADNEPDLEFYAFACDLVRRRRVSGRG
jgi:hypothetical protein